MDVCEMYNKNQNLIHLVIRKHFPQFINTMDYDDAFQEGSIALLQAIKKFNPERGIKFSTYAYYAIKNTISRSMYKSNSIFSVSRNSFETYITYLKYFEEGLDFDEIVLKLNTTPTKLLNIIRTFNEDYFERELNANSDDRLLKVADKVADDFNVERNYELKYETTTLMILCKTFLPETYFTTLIQKMKGKNQRSISKQIGCSQAHVSRIVRKIRSKILPLFKKYLEGEITYGKLCLELMKYLENAEQVFECYLDYVAEVDNGQAVFNVKKIRWLFHNGLHKTHQSTIQDAINEIDKFYSKDGIEEVIYNKLKVNCLECIG